MADCIWISSLPDVNWNGSQIWPTLLGTPSVNCQEFCFSPQSAVEAVIRKRYEQKA